MNHNIHLSVFLSVNSVKKYVNKHILKRERTCLEKLYEASHILGEQNFKFTNLNNLEFKSQGIYADNLI